MLQRSFPPICSKIKQNFAAIWSFQDISIFCRFLCITFLYIPILYISLYLYISHFFRFRDITFFQFRDITFLKYIMTQHHNFHLSIHTTNVHQMFTKCSPNVHQMFTIQSPNVHHSITKCSPNVHEMFPLTM